MEQTSVLPSTRSSVRSRCHSLFFFFSLLSSIHFVCFLLFMLFWFIYNIYRITYLREIIFPCMTHNKHSFFLFQYLTNYLSLKLRTNENNERRGALLWTERASTFCLRSHRDHFAFFIALARLCDQKINDISSTTWTKQNKKHFFLRKLSKLDPIYIYVCVCVCVCVCVGHFNSVRRLLKVWDLFPFHPLYVTCFLCLIYD